jgi:hypothetical protein
MRLSLKIVNDELARLGHTARLAKGSGYFYFQFGEAAGWLDRTVRVRKINDLTLKKWIIEFLRLKELNEQIMRTAGQDRAKVSPPRAAGGVRGGPKRP